MTMTVKNNMSAVHVLGTYNKNNSALAKSLSQVSSGMKINSARDDPAAYAISERMRIQIRGLEQCSQNVKNGKYLVTSAMGGLEQIKNSLERMAQLADQSSNDIMNDNDRATVQKEFSQLRDNITDIAVTTNFNGQTPLHPIGKPKDEEPYTFSGKADIVFLVDTTSSMGAYIGNVASNMEKFTNSLRDMNIDYRIAIVSFNDQDVDPMTTEAYIPDSVVSNIDPSVLTGETTIDGQHYYTSIAKRGELPKTELDFSNDSSAVSSKLNKIASEVGDTLFRGAGGSFEPESGLEGVKVAINLLQDSREGSVKQIIVITDATFHDSTDTEGIESLRISSGGIGTAPSYYLNVNDVIDNLKAANVRLSAVTNPRHSTWAQQGVNSPGEEWGWLTDATGGENLDLLSDDYGSHLTLIAQGTAEAAGLEGNKADSNIEWRNILKADNGFELGSAFVKDIYIHTGTEANQNLKIALYDHIETMLKLHELDISQRKNAVYARESLDIVIQKILDHSAEYGAVAQRLDKADDNIATSMENLQGAESRIRDADMAKAMVNYTKVNVLTQAAQSMLAQANQSSNDVLGLLQ